MIAVCQIPFLMGFSLKKMDSSGNLIWYRTVTSELSEAINPHVVKVDKENNIYMIGQSVGKFYIDSNTNTGYGGIDIFIMKYDKDGNFKWAKILGTSQTDYFMNDAMQVTNEGEVLVTGNIAWENKDTITEAFFDTIKTTLHSPISRMFIANFDTNGNIKWLKNTTGFASPFSLSVDKNKNIYISGSCLDSV